jgi:hypothetical protein
MNDDERDVIRGATFEADLDELVGRSVYVAPRYASQKLIGREQPRQTIARKKESVFVLQLARHAGHFQVRGSADGACHDVGVGVGCGFTGLQFPSVDELLHETMVVRELGDGAVANTVGPAVAYPQAAEAERIRSERDNGGADRSAGRGPGEQFLIAPTERRPRGLDHLRERSLGVDSPQVAHHAGAGDGPGLMAAHPVSHRPERQSLAAKHGVFVRPPPSPDMSSRNAMKFQTFGP